jgi:hypothetical protein
MAHSASLSRRLHSRENFRSQLVFFLPGRFHSSVCRIRSSTARQWLLIVFGVIAFPVGLFLWNGLGIYFGLGETKGKVDLKISVATFALLLFVIAVELVIGSR